MSASSSSSKPPPAQAGPQLGLKCLAGGLGCGLAGFLTNPMDVVKIRNQQFGKADPQLNPRSHDSLAHGSIGKSLAFEARDPRSSRATTQ